MAGSAAAPAVRCRNRRRANSVPFTLNGWPCGMAALTGRRCVRLLFDTIGWVPALFLRLSLRAVRGKLRTAEGHLVWGEFGFSRAWVDGRRLLRDLPDLDRLEEAGLLGKAP